MGARRRPHPHAADERPPDAARPRTPGTGPLGEDASTYMLLGISLGPASPFQGESMAAAASLQDRWPVLAAVPPALAWLGMRADLGIAPRTLDAYARGACPNTWRSVRHPAPAGLTAAREACGRSLRRLRAVRRYSDTARRKRKPHREVGAHSPQSRPDGCPPPVQTGPMSIVIAQGRSAITVSWDTIIAAHGRDRRCSTG